MKEKKIDEENNSNITRREKLINFKSSIFFPTQIKVMLLSKVANA